MRISNLAELQAERGGLVTAARKKLEEIKQGSSKEEVERLENEHDEIMSRFDLIEVEIRTEEAAAIHEADVSAALKANRPGGSSIVVGADDGQADYRAKQGWADHKGNPVRVLSRSDTLAKRSDDMLGFGDVVRAKVTGARNEAEKRALAEGTDSAGGFTVPTPLAAQFIDRLRARSVAIQAGSQTVPMTSETLAIARLASDPDVGWRAENSTLAEGDPTFDRVKFEAKTLAGMIRISRELAEDSLNVGQMIETAFAGAMATKLDFAALYGDGTGNSPTGVVNTAGINSVSMATNGAALTNYDKLIDAIYEMHANDAGDPTAQIMNPRTLAALAKLKDGDGNPMVVPEMVRGVPMLQTTSAPIDETQGTATNASSIVFGDFRHLMIGMRSEVEIRVYDQPLASTGQLLIAAWMRADVQLSQPKCFTQLKGIKPTT